MSAVTAQGILREGWRAQLPEYPIALAWAPGGGSLEVLDAAGGLHSLDARTGATRWCVQDAHPGGGLALSQHPRGPLLATGGQDGAVVVWDRAQGAERRRYPSLRAWVEHVAWSSDGRWLAAAAGRAAYAWSEEGAEWTSPPHPSTVSALSWAKDEELATACYGRVSLWRPPNVASTESFEWQGSLVAMVISPDGAIVACGSQDQSVHFWRRATGEDSMMSGYALKPTALAFDSTSALLATSGGEMVTVWCFSGDGPEGSEPGQLSLHPLPVSALAFAHGERVLASGGREGGVVVWRLTSVGGGRPIGGALLTSAIAKLAWRPDNHALAAADAEGGVTVWRTHL